MKKEYHIPIALLELKEQLHYITVFYSLYNGIDRATKKIKKVFDTVLKRECLISLLYNKDLLVGVRIIAAMDNW